MIQKIKVRINRSEDRGVFHDSRKDSRTLGEAINILIDKVNELVETNNRLEKEKAELEMLRSEK